MNYERMADFIRAQFPAGTRIRLNQMRDPYAPVSPGTEGVVDCVDDIGQIHMKWDNGRTLALIPGEDSFTKIAPKLETLKLYMPLTVVQYERDEWGALEEYPDALDQRTILHYSDQILAAILKERLPEETERGLMCYYHCEGDGVNEKVQSLFFTVEQVGSRLMGVAECHVQGSLSDEELRALKAYVVGQAADGFGESLEQHPIKVDGAELYVSLWNSSNQWNIQTEQALRQMSAEVTPESPQMRGMQLG